MVKTDVDSILLAHSYFLSCKSDNPKCPKTDLARKYLTKLINKALTERKKSTTKTLLIF